MSKGFRVERLWGMHLHWKSCDKIKLIITSSILMIASLAVCCFSSTGETVAGKGSMKIFLERSGGIAGRTVLVSVNTADLTAGESIEVKQMVEKAGFFQLPEKMGSPMPDQFQYRLTIEQKGRSHSVLVQGEKMPEPLRQLVNWLLSKRQTQGGN
jgi:hypothetical protein